MFRGGLCLVVQEKADLWEVFGPAPKQFRLGLIDSVLNVVHLFSSFFLYYFPGSRFVLCLSNFTMVFFRKG